MEGARSQMLTLTCAQRRLDTAAIQLLGALAETDVPRNSAWCRVLVTMFSLESALFNTSLKINFGLSL